MRKVRDTFPIMVSRTPDVIPSTPSLPTVQMHNLPTNPELKENHPHNLQGKTVRIDSREQSLSVDRPGREIKPPFRFKDYVSYKRQ